MPDQLLADFIDEAHRAWRCAHPQIVQLVGYCDEPGHLALVAEFVNRGSLFDVLHSKLELPSKARLQLALDVASGLQYLHKQGVIHRDLKSTNVLVDDNIRAKLSDFGQAKMKVQTAFSAPKSVPTGTRRWKAPELFRRNSIANEAADIYALGMILWEISSRQIPFADAESEETAIDWIKSGERENIPSECPEGMAKVISQCWDADPTKRPSIDQVVLQLQTTLENLDSQQKKTVDASLSAFGLEKADTEMSPLAGISLVKREQKMNTTVVVSEPSPTISASSSTTTSSSERDWGISSPDAIPARGINTRRFGTVELIIGADRVTLGEDMSFSSLSAVLGLVASHLSRVLDATSFMGVEMEDSGQWIQLDNVIFGMLQEYEPLITLRPISTRGVVLGN